MADYSSQDNNFIWVIYRARVIFLFAALCFFSGMLLNACTPAINTPAITAEAPTQPSTPTESPTPTLEPTNEPTATIEPTDEPVNIDFQMPDSYQEFEAQWPLDRIEQTDGHVLRCAVDTANFQYGEVPLPGGQIMKSWAMCYFITSDGRTDYVNIPIFVEDAANGKKFMTFAVEPSDLAGSGFLIPALKKALEELYLPHALGTPQLEVRVVGASFDPDPAQQITPGQQFFDKVYEDIDMSGIDSFAASGDTSKLPAVGTVDHFLVIDALNFDVR